ncbi:MAG: hypothetical protein ABIQ32_03815 [Sphingomicrobium sp.]
MVTRKQWRRFINLPAVQWSMFVLGLLLLVCAAIVGTIPGPGGVFFAVPGLILLLNSSMWARRNYAKLKQWEHKRGPVILGRKVTPGRWADLMLRRPSALRRERLRKEREEREQATLPAADD